MPNSTNVQTVCTTAPDQSCVCSQGSTDPTPAKKLRTVGAKPSFENGYVTMNEDGLAIAMIPKQT